MPRFLCYCPDHPDILDKRMAVRPQHLERAQKDKEIMPYSGPILPRPGTKAREVGTHTADGGMNIAGSFMVYVFPTLDDVWARLKEDVYWTADIWDKDRIIVEELIG